jgi:hypothetical protein
MTFLSCVNFVVLRDTTTSMSSLVSIGNSSTPTTVVAILIPQETKSGLYVAACGKIDQPNCDCKSTLSLEHNV